jgi:hypothetical protein
MLRTRSLSSARRLVTFTAPMQLRIDITRGAFFKSLVDKRKQESKCSNIPRAIAVPPAERVTVEAASDRE